MMYIMHRKSSGVESQYTWHIGEPILYEEIAWVNGVYAVQADGDELQFVLTVMFGLPYVKVARVQRWYGDDAKFIAGNL